MEHEKVAYWEFYKKMDGKIYKVWSLNGKDWNYELTALEDSPFVTFDAAEALREFKRHHGA